MEFPELSLKKHTDSFVDAAKSQFGGILLLVGAIWLLFFARFYSLLRSEIGGWPFTPVTLVASWESRRCPLCIKTSRTSLPILSL